MHVAAERRSPSFFPFRALIAGALVALVGCRSELKTGVGNPGGPVSQLVIGSSTVHFDYTPGTPFPAPVSVGVTGTPSLVDGLVIGTILYSPISSGWLSADLGSGGNATPTSVVLTATPPADLAPGSYVASIPVGSTVTGVTTQYIIATLTVAPAPQISVSPSTVTIAVSQGGPNPAPQFVEVDNGGSGALTGLSAGTIVYGQGATGWLSASLNQTTAPATLTLQATTGTIPSGTYTAQVPIASSLPGVAPTTVFVSLGVSAISTPPTIQVSPTNVAVSAVTGGANPAAQPVSVSNGGGGSLTGLAVGSISYGAGANAWLSASINSTTAPATISAQAKTGALAAGVYTATVQVTSSLAGVAPSSFVVTFTVAAAPQPPVINLAPALAAFTASAGGSNPAAIPVAVTNGGGGSLALLSLGSISYGAGATGWLSATLSNTTAPATITLNATVGALTQGTYTATVPVNSALSGVASKTLTITFTVIGSPAPPAIGLSPTSLTLTGQAGGANPAAKTVTVTNAGAGSLTGLATGTVTYQTGQPTGWLAASVSPTTAPATITLQATTGALTAGTYNARVPVTSPVANNSPRTIAVTFTVTGAPALVLTPPSITFTGTTGQPNPTPGTIAITNAGAGALTGLAAGAVSYTSGQPTGWLNTSLSSTTTPATLVLSPVTGSLVAGIYTATVPISTTTAGVVSQSVNVSFQVGAPGGGLLLVQGDNQTGNVNTQLPVQLQAQVVDAASNPKAGVTVIWQVNNGGQLKNVVSISSATGIVSADWVVGPLAGIHTVTVSSAGLPTLTFQADVLLPSNPGSHPNEPAGFVAFAEHDLSALPGQARGLGGLKGAWYAIGSNNLGVVTPDLTAPESPPNVFQVRFPKGFPSGSGPVNFGGWDAAGKTAGQKSKIYFSMWLKCVGNDFENQAVGTKMGFFGAAAAISQTAHNTWFFLKGTGTQTIAPNFKLEEHQSNPNPINLPQNVDTRMLMNCGVWHQWEAVMEINTLGVADGVFKWWVDGILIMDRPNSTFIYSGATNKFFDYVFNPTWGGLGGSKTRDDFWRIDHIYISGVP